MRVSARPCRAQLSGTPHAAAPPETRRARPFPPPPILNKASPFHPTSSLPGPCDATPARTAVASPPQLPRPVQRSNGGGAAAPLTSRRARPTPTLSEGHERSSKRGAFRRRHSFVVADDAAWPERAAVSILSAGGAVSEAPTLFVRARATNSPTADRAPPLSPRRPAEPPLHLAVLSTASSPLSQKSVLPDGRDPSRADGGNAAAPAIAAPARPAAAAAVAAGGRACGRPRAAQAR
eukprot:366122-Chlamydomonas_euryale.AAC.1